ncbi:hypothetical protein HMPREF0662_02086, partial [Prevotella nigrescens F0103]
MKNIDFNNIRLVNGSLNDGFEEFVCQLDTQRGHYRHKEIC